MRVLHLIPYIIYPPVFGGAIRIYHLLTHLAKYHTVTVVSMGSEQDSIVMKSRFGKLVNGIYTAPYPRKYSRKRLGQFFSLFNSRSYGISRFVSRKMQAVLDHICEHKVFDVVQTEFPMMGRYRLPTEATRILDAHNVEFDLAQRLRSYSTHPIRRVYNYLEYRKLYHEEIQICADQDVIFTTSDRDKDLLATEIPAVPKHVVPNGVDTNYFTPAAGQPDPNTLVFVGSMGYVPNNDGMIYFLDKIFPLIQRRIPDARIVIVGGNPSPALLARASDHIILTGFVEDVREYIGRASVYVVPLRIGGGTRLKILEAMAMKRPVVSTAIGCEGIAVTDEETIRIEDDPEHFAGAVIELLRDARERKRISENAYELVLEEYEWSVVTERMLRYYETLRTAPAWEEVA
ncbi:MAG TPA: glycosyltransferase family 4 protein [bacterium]|nr:glycosyltransferase family 4 protein [bacterium]